jgi:hypothetical protein
MDQRKLYQVLVIGGALVGLGCDEESARGAEDGGQRSETTPPSTDAGGAEPDAALADAAPLADAEAVDGPRGMTDAAPGTADAGGDLEDCGFCPNEWCCVDDGMGGPKARDGFECCWATSC